MLKKNKYKYITERNGAHKTSACGYANESNPLFTKNRHVLPSPM